jgi:peroxiredoxin
LRWSQSYEATSIVRHIFYQGATRITADIYERLGLCDGRLPGLRVRRVTDAGAESKSGRCPGHVDSQAGTIDRARFHPHRRPWRTDRLSDFRGKVVLLDFWATWCGGCKLEIPWYMEFDKKFRGQGLAVIGVSMDEEGWKVVRPFLARKVDAETGGNTAMQYPVVIGNDTLAKEYNLTSMPMTLLIDREGRIALSHTGVVNKDDFQSHILQLLK